MRRQRQRIGRSRTVWSKGQKALKAKLGIKTVWDLSGTPFFLNGSGYDGALFPLGRQRRLAR